MTTAFPRKGHYALDPVASAGHTAADAAVGRIGNLLDYDMADLCKATRAGG